MVLPDVTLAIAVRNEPLLKRTVESALATRDGVNLEIIIADDSSTDNCADGLSKIKHVVVFRTTLNGASLTKTFAIEQGRAHRIIVCDAHMLYPKGWLQAFIKALDTYPRSLICATSGYYRPQAKKELYGCSWHYSAKYGFIGPIWIERKPPRPIIEIPALMGACYGFTKETWNYLPGLPPVEGWGWLEAFLSASANLMGIPILLLRDVVVRHRYYSPKEGHSYPQTSQDTHEIKRVSTQILFDDLREVIQKARYNQVFTDGILNEKGREQKAKIQAGRILTDWEWLTRHGLLGNSKNPGLIRRTNKNRKPVRRK